MESSDSYDSGRGGGGGGTERGGRGVICIDYDGRPASEEEVVGGYEDEDEVRGLLIISFIIRMVGNCASSKLGHEYKKLGYMYKARLKGGSQVV